LLHDLIETVSIQVFCEVEGSMIARTIAVAFFFALAVAPPASANHQDPLPPIPLGSIAVGLKPIADGLRGPDWLTYAPGQVTGSTFSNRPAPSG